MSTVLIIQSPTIDPCCADSVFGMEKTIFIIDKHEWISIQKLLNNKTIDITEYKCGQCEQPFKTKYLKIIMAECKIIEKNPSDDVIHFVKKIQNKNLINLMRENVKKIKSKKKQGISHYVDDESSSSESVPNICDLMD
jgi:hypothetical protein